MIQCKKNENKVFIIIGGCFSDVFRVAFYHVASGVLPNTWDSHGHVLFYSGFIDSTFLRICAVPRIADLWRL